MRILATILTLSLMTLARAGSHARSEADSVDQKHWAFERVKEVTPPADASNWSVNPIDQFVIAKLRAQKLTPVGLANKRTLARRLYFDLIGLPPSLEEIERFVDDSSPDALAKLTDRLLASPRYGERWGRHWMDVARYADTAGDNADYPIPEARLYRDYIIGSFNADKPYDQFVREQLAGDILAKQGPRDRYAEQLIATGFIALSRRYGTGPYELWHLVLEDTIETTGRAFMGMTFRCARCHDHKYDPVKQEDYYALYGMFASTRYPWAGSEEVESKKFNRLSFVPLVPDRETASTRQSYAEKLERLKSQVAQIEKNDPLVASIAALTNQLQVISNEVHALTKQSRELPSLQIQMAALQKLSDEEKKRLREKLKPPQAELRGLEIPGVPPELAAAYAVEEGEALDACLQLRGEPAERGAVVRRDVPQFLAARTKLNIPKGASGRLQLAEWLTRPDHPLTARVMVNRIWQHHFGRGLVATPSNFGLRGEAPTHPELLDWLSIYFTKNGWSIKALHRLIVQSKTYQLASVDDAASAEVDPDNRFYWRHERRRLDAEALRDAMLFVAGNLDFGRPGLHPFPGFQDWKWTQHNPFKTNYASMHRSVYLMTQRFQRHSYVGLFDGPDPNTSTDARTVSTVPAQALFMMNNPFVQAQATALARRLLASESDDVRRLQRAGAFVWARPIEGEACRRTIDYLAALRRELERAGLAKEQIELEAWTSVAKILLMGNEFIYVD
jgi:hypothetical protein